MSVPTKKSRVLYVRVTEKMYEKAEKAADKMGLTVPEFIRAVVANHLSKGEVTT